MSHRKILSQGSIPFSWEDKPGVSRISPEEYQPLDTGLESLNSSSSKSTTLQPTRPAPTDSSSFDSSVNPDQYHHQHVKIPLPPCPSQQPLHRSISSKGLIGWWREDPFLAAYKECTKSARSSSIKMSASDYSKKSSVGSKLLPRKKSKFIFSCKNSGEVREDNYVRLSNLPPLPKERQRTYI